MDPTDACPFPPGSPGKLRHLAARARLELPLFRADDARLPERQALWAVLAGNGVRMLSSLVRLRLDGSVEVIEKGQGWS